MIRCILIDDEPFAREALDEYIQRIPNLNLMGSFEDPLEALEFMDENPVDLIFSDIQMPDMDGISFLRSLENPPQVIFVTGHPSFAVESFELDVLDYILKPYSLERLLKAVNKAKAVIKPAQEIATKDYLTVQEGYKTFLVQFGDICFIEGLHDYVKVVTNEKTYIVKQTMRSSEASLPSNFIRIQKSYIVNLHYIESVSSCQVTLKAISEKLPIGLTYRDEFYKKVGVHR